MTSRAEALSRFEREHSRFVRAGHAVESLIQEITAPAGIHPTVSFRVKTVHSFRAKLERKDYSDPWADVTDKVGARAIVQRASDVDRIRDLICEDGRLAIRTETDKRTELAPNQLGYSGLHLDLVAPAEAEDSEPILCELQIRTIAQDAWSVVEHKLIYKPQREALPAADRRSILRLVALVEVFDQEVERIMDQQSQTYSTITPDSDLVTVVRAQYATFESNSGDRDLTLAVVSAIDTALSESRVGDYRPVLDDYVQQNRSALRLLYDHYGAQSSISASPAYVLWTQPESLALLECLENRPAHLLAAWDLEGLPRPWLEQIVSAAGLDVGL